MEKHPTAKWLVEQIDRRRPSPHEMIDIMDSRPLQGCKVSFKGAIEGGPQDTEQLFNDWVAEVKRSVPADRLLVHSAKEGWAPLCNFLGLPIPEGSYPRVNDAASIASMATSCGGSIVSYSTASPLLLLLLLDASTGPIWQLDMTL